LLQRSQVQVVPAFRWVKGVVGRGRDD
jgi:hypothetical protein